MTTRTVGYLRVSTASQDLEKNKADILAFANDRRFGTVDWVAETISGKVHWRQRAIHNVIAKLGSGDRLIVAELSRLGRSMLEIMEILSVAKDKGISVYAVKGAWELNGTIQSKIIAMVFGMAAEIERDLISQRTKEALRVRKFLGVKLGRPKGAGRSRLDSHRDEIVALLKTGVPKAKVARKYGVVTTTLINWLGKNGLSAEVQTP